MHQIVAKFLRDTQSDWLNAKQNAVARLEKARSSHRCKWIKSALKIYERKKMWFPSLLDMLKVKMVLDVFHIHGEFRILRSGSGEVSEREKVILSEFEARLRDLKAVSSVTEDRIDRADASKELPEVIDISGEGVDSEGQGV